MSLRFFRVYAFFFSFSFSLSSGRTGAVLRARRSSSSLPSPSQSRVEPPIWKAQRVREVSQKYVASAATAEQKQCLHLCRLCVCVCESGIKPGARSLRKWERARKSEKESLKRACSRPSRHTWSQLADCSQSVSQPVLSASALKELAPTSRHKLCSCTTSCCSLKQQTDIHIAFHGFFFILAFFPLHFFALWQKYKHNQKHFFYLAHLLRLNKCLAAFCYHFPFLLRLTVCDFLWFCDQVLSFLVLLVPATFLKWQSL